MGRASVVRKLKAPKATKPKSMVDAIFTSTQQRVLGLLFGQPDRKFISSELIKLSHIGSGAVQRELVALAESGLISVEQSGKQKYYQANHGSPIFDELKSITLKTVGLAEPLVLALTHSGGTIELAFIYGSVAKGTAKASSDIDLLVVSDDLTTEELYRTLEPVEVALSRKISVTLYTPHDFRQKLKAKNAFLEKVIKGEHTVLIGDEHALG